MDMYGVNGHRKDRDDNWKFVWLYNWIEKKRVIKFYRHKSDSEKLQVQKYITHHVSHTRGYKRKI